MCVVSTHHAAVPHAVSIADRNVIVSFSFRSFSSFNHDIRQSNRLICVSFSVISLSLFIIPHIPMPRDTALDAFVPHWFSGRKATLGPRLNVQLFYIYYGYIYMVIRVLN